MKSDIDKRLDQILSGNLDALDDQTDDDQLSSDGDGELVEPPKELVPVVFEPQSSELTLADGDIQTDYQFARSNLYGLIGRSNAALELAMQLGAMSENPRALEVAASLIKTSGTLSRDLISIHQEVKANEQANHPFGATKQPVTNTQINNYYTSKEELKDVNDILDSIDDKKPNENNNKNKKQKKVSDEE